MADITQALDASSINLEKNATDQFGAAVEDFSRGGQDMGNASSFQTSNNSGQPRNERSFYSTSYAAALAGPTSFRPKLRFLFKVQFFFTEEAKAMFTKLSGGSDSLGDNDFTFMVKSVDRPKIDLEYEDDVNMYNFRTKALKKIRHRELTMTFLDDTGNRVFDFFDRMMMLYSPITRRSKTRVSPFDKPTPYLNTEIGNGMVFSDPNSGISQEEDLSHRGVINSPVGNAIESIRVKQIFVDSSEVNLSNALKQNCFDFVNPRIVSFDLDELSYESSDPSSLIMQFDYDWLEMVSMTITDNSQLTPRYDHIANPSAVGAPIDISASTSGNGISGGGNGHSYTGVNNTVSPSSYTQKSSRNTQQEQSILNGIIQTSKSELQNNNQSFVKNNSTRGSAPIVYDSAIVSPVNASAFITSAPTYYSTLIPQNGET